MNLISKAEQFIKRPVLAKLVGTNETYLCVLSQKPELTEEMEDRVLQAVGKVIRELSKLQEQDDD